MSHNKVIATIVEPVPMTHFEKFKTFVTDPRTVKYGGRTIVVITLATLLYLCFKHRKAIKQTCSKCIEATKNKFRREPKDIVIPEKVTTVNLNINHPLNFNVKVVKDGDSSEQGKSLMEESVDKVEAVKSSPSFQLTDTPPAKPKDDKGWSLF